MRLATILEDGTALAAIVEGDRVLPLAVPDPGLRSIRGIAAAGGDGLARVRDWVAHRPASDWRSLAGVRLGPAVPDPGAVYTIGDNYRAAPGDGPDDGRPGRPLVFGKAASAVAAPGATLRWDRSLTDNVDAECELGVVIGRAAWEVPAARAMDHVLGYTIINDISSRDPWLDGDQWLLGKSLPGFCPVGPWLVTPDELSTEDLGLGCRINGDPIQAASTSQLRFGIAEIIAFLSRHAVLRPGDLVATGTPRRLDAPPGPDRRLRAGDEVTCWIDGIGELTTSVA